MLHRAVHITHCVQISYLLCPTLSTSFMDLALHTPPLEFSRPCSKPVEVAGMQREGRGRGHALNHTSVSVCISSDHRNKIIKQYVVLLGLFCIRFRRLLAVASQRQEKANKREP